MYDSSNQMLETQDSLEGPGSWSDASRGYKDVPGIHNGTNKAEYAQKTVSICKATKPETTGLTYWEYNAAPENNGKHISIPGLAC